VLCRQVGGEVDALNMIRTFFGEGLAMIRPTAVIAFAGIAALLAAQSALSVPLLLPTADTNVEEHTPDSDDTLQPRIQVRSRADAGSGRQNVGYFQFDLASIAAPVTRAEFGISLQSTLSSAAGANRVFGLNDVAGNTAQNWTNLTYNTTGDEIPGDGNPETTDIGSVGITGAENLWDIGALPAITGVAESFVVIDEVSNPELLNFLSSRIGGFATLLIVQNDDVDNELLFNSSEDPLNLRPYLNLNKAPEASTFALLVIGFISLCSCTSSKWRPEESRP
jgi:hypothetical protein